ncbi:MAG: extracellular solute-binding protein, partial [Anaerolineaceae bacterium]
MKKFQILFAVVLISSLLLAACATPTPEKVIETVIVEKAGEKVVETVEVLITPTPAPKEKKLEIFHWWTAPGEREAADEMFAALKAAYPDISIVENPVPGGGGTEHRVVLKARITAGIPPDTVQTLGGAELKDYVDSNVLQPLDDFYAETGYGDVIPKPLLNAVTINGHPYSVPLNMHLENILYYNLKLFEELGLSAPTGYDDLIAACKAIKAAHPEMSC